MKLMATWLKFPSTAILGWCAHRRGYYILGEGTSTWVNDRGWSITVWFFVVNITLETRSGFLGI